MAVKLFFEREETEYILPKSITRCYPKPVAQKLLYAVGAVARNVGRQSADTFNGIFLNL